MALAKNSDTAFTIITPHEGEAKKLGYEIKDPKDRPRVALEMAKKLHVIVVLKGNNTLIASPDGTVITNKSGGPELATAGTGDVLAGILGALLALNKGKVTSENLIEIGATASYIHAEAAKLNSKGPVSASGMVMNIPAIIAKISD